MYTAKLITLNLTQRKFRYVAPEHRLRFLLNAAQDAILRGT